jgi:hypothetical protein
VRGAKNILLAELKASKVSSVSYQRRVLRKHYIKLKHECSLIIDKKHKRERISGNTIVGIKEKNASEDGIEIMLKFRFLQFSN